MCHNAMPLSAEGHPDQGRETDGFAARSQDG
jgi:hypothetical protein